MNQLAALVKPLSLVNRFIATAGVFLASCFIAMMTCVVIAGVFFRYVLNDSITWVEDVSLILMVTMAFIIAPYALRTGGNVAIELIVSKLPTLFQRVIRLIIYSAVLWVLYRYLFESFALVERGWNIRVNTLPIQWAWCYMIIPIVFIALIAGTVELILRELHGIGTGNSDLDLDDRESKDSPTVTEHR